MKMAFFYPQISLGGFMCCYYEEEINKAKQ